MNTREAALDRALEDALGHTDLESLEMDPKEFGITTDRTEFYKGATMPTGVYDRVAARARREQVISNGQGEQTEFGPIVKVLQAKRDKLMAEVEKLDAAIATLKSI